MSLGACGREPAHAKRYVDGGDGDSPVARARAVQWAGAAAESLYGLGFRDRPGPWVWLRFRLAVSAKGLGFARDIPCSAGGDVAAGRACTLGEPEI